MIKIQNGQFDCFKTFVDQLVALMYLSMSEDSDTIFFLCIRITRVCPSCLLSLSHWQVYNHYYQLSLFEIHKKFQFSKLLFIGCSKKHRER